MAFLAALLELPVRGLRVGVAVVKRAVARVVAVTVFDYSKIVASASGVEHECCTAWDAMLNGLFLDTDEKSVPDLKISHTTLCMGSKAVCEPRYLPNFWLKSANESMASTMFVIASTLLGANNLRMFKGEVKDKSSLNSSTVAVVPR